MSSVLIEANPVRLCAVCMGDLVRYGTPEYYCGTCGWPDARTPEHVRKSDHPSEVETLRQRIRELEAEKANRLAAPPPDEDEDITEEPDTDKAATPVRVPQTVEEEMATPAPRPLRGKR